MIGHAEPLNESRSLQTHTCLLPGLLTLGTVPARPCHSAGSGSSTCLAERCGTSHVSSLGLGLLSDAS